MSKTKPPKLPKKPPEPREAFIGTEYLDDGKGPAARMIRITPRKLRSILTTWSVDNGSDEDDVDAIVDAIVAQCENLDPGAEVDDKYHLHCPVSGGGPDGPGMAFVSVSPGDAIKLYELRDKFLALAKDVPGLAAFRLLGESHVDAEFGWRDDEIEDAADVGVAGGWTSTKRVGLTEDDDYDHSLMLVNDLGVQWEMVGKDSPELPCTEVLPWSLVETIAKGHALGGKPDGK